MDLATLAHLRTPAGAAALHAAASLNPTEARFLPCLTALQKQFDPPLAKAALETVILRAQAHAKFSRAEAMFFQREALEQASGEVVSTYRAARYTPFHHVLDVCCGLGGDGIGLAGAVPALTVLDHDPLRLALAEANLAAYGRHAHTRLADVAAAPLPPAEALWFDPARRAAGRRTYHLHDYQPPLTLLAAWRAHTAPIGVKLSPGLDVAELGAFVAPPFELEFISYQGDLKEAVLWLGALAGATARRATRLDSAGRAHTLTAAQVPPPTVRPPSAYLLEPDPAILRAGLVTVLAEHLNAHQLDPDIAYLSTATRPHSPWVTAYTIEAAMPFNLKRLRAYLRERQVGEVTVKKRGSPLEPEAVRAQLKLRGPNTATVCLTHVNGQHTALLVTRCAD